MLSLGFALKCFQCEFTIDGITPVAECEKPTQLKTCSKGQRFCRTVFERSGNAFVAKFFQFLESILQHKNV